jgi:hypothetical protein
MEGSYVGGHSLAHGKPGVSEDQRARDQAECAATAAAADTVRSVTLTAAERESIDACMRDRGDTLVAQRR